MTGTRLVARGDLTAGSQIQTTLQLGPSPAYFTTSRAFRSASPIVATAPALKLM
jgi:hypothetical protein